jgi:acetyl-CoA carboxylase carboxyltransferase component
MKIQSQIDTKSPTFKENYEHQLGACKRLQAAVDLVHTSAKGDESKKKLSAYERVYGLIDRGSQLLELSTLAGHKLYEDDVPGGGILTGVGMISGRPCMIVANNSAVKGGTYYPITVKKHLRAQKIAEQLAMPCIYLVDSGGAYLPMQDEVFPDQDDFGRIFYNQAQMSAKGIAQIASVHGFCTAGGAYIPAMSDQSVMVAGNGTIFLAGPPLVKAATGEDVSAEDLGGARVHTTISGVADHLAQNDEHALLIVREIVSRLGAHKQASVNLRAPIAPAYDPDEILGILPRDPKKAFDSREIIARLVDGSEFFEFKAGYGTTLSCGFAHIEGIPVGIIANNGVLFSESALKGSHFIELCCQEKIPLLFLQNITGFIVGKKYEHGGIAKDGAKLVHAVANARVPKVTVVIGGSYGAGNYGMCGRAYDPNFMFMWPESRISVMGGEQAAEVLVTVKQQQLSRKNLPPLTAEQIAAIKAPILAKYDLESSSYYASARIWDDGIIDPRTTRRILAQALASSLHHAWQDSRFGVFRM